MDLSQRTEFCKYNYFIFLKILFHLKNLLQGVDLMYQQPKYPYPYFS